MMKTDLAKIISNEKIAKDVYKMVLETSLTKDVQCGQFIEVEVPGYFLRRPISVCETKDKTIVLVYKIVGDGTSVMSTLQANDKVSLFGPCGHGFPVEDSDVTLIGGGVGVPPLLQTAKEYRARKHKVTVVLGFNTEQDRILIEDFLKIGCEVYVATMDGSKGVKGTVMNAIEAYNLKVDFVLSCGPLPMLKAVSQKYKNGYISLESRMACGLGACMGCVIKDVDDNSLRVCKDGPVFAIERVAL